jgi:hypothetical protein
MSKTAQHQLVRQDGSQNVIDALSAVDLGALSFIQLHRLQKVLQQASADVAAEAERRADADASGDTVKVQSPNL